MEIRANYPLKNLNTFGIDARAQYYVRADSEEDLALLARDEFYRESRKVIIGEGSNLLFLADLCGIALCSGIRGIQEIARTEEYVTLRVGSAERWDDFAAYCVERNFYGAENLSHIPGTVGAAAVQNIGAYGVEVADLIRSVEAFDLLCGREHKLSRSDCKFAYRHSIFKEAGREDLFVTYVEFRLYLKPHFTCSYADLVQRFPAGGAEPALSDIRKAVIEIRQSKLPDTNELGSAGSFFKNPVVDNATAERLRMRYPEMPVYPAVGGNGQKLSAAFLIDRAGLKGYRQGNAGIYDRQPLVLVNYGGATGREIAALSEKIRETVMREFGVDLEPEVRFI